MTVLLILAGCQAGGGAASIRTSSGQTAVPPAPTLDKSLVAQGQEVYQRECASCHGDKAEGQPNWEKSNAQGNMPAPPHDDTGHTWRHSDAQLYDITRKGWRDPFNKTPELTMPAFGDKLSEGEIRAVTEYFKSLWSAEHRQFQWDETRKRGG